VGQQDADIADTLQLRDVATVTMFWLFYIWGPHWRHLANTTEQSMCGGDAVLYQIILTACSQFSPCGNVKWAFKVLRVCDTDHSILVVQ